MTSLLDRMDHGDMVAAVDAWFEGCRGKRESIPTCIGIALQVLGTLLYATTFEVVDMCDYDLALLGLDTIQKRAKEAAEPQEWLIT